MFKKKKENLFEIIVNYKDVWKLSTPFGTIYDIEINGDEKCMGDVLIELVKRLARRNREIKDAVDTLTKN